MFKKGRMKSRKEAEDEEREPGDNQERKGKESIQKDFKIIARKIYNKNIPTCFTSPSSVSSRDAT